MEVGAIGIACATAWEAIVMAEGEIEDVLIANQLVQNDKVAEPRAWRATIASRSPSSTRATCSSSRRRPLRRLASLRPRYLTARSVSFADRERGSLADGQLPTVSQRFLELRVTQLCSDQCESVVPLLLHP
jgi:hypothetical protein